MTTFVPRRAAIRWLGLMLAVLAAGIASIALRQDSNWDLQNYHLYNAWAFVHGRYGIDWAPAQLQSFYSPFLDLPFYALLAADMPPRVIAFLLAVPTGIAWFFCVRIAARLFDDVPSPQRLPVITVAIALAVTAPMSISLIGLTMNDWYTAAMVMPALWLMVRHRGGDTASTATLLAAGALVGASAGLKLTGSIYAVGLVGGLCLAGGTLRVRMRPILVAMVSMTVAFAATAGPWMWLNYARYGNPVFPYYNGIFRSPWTEAGAVAANPFGPSSAAEWLAFPFMLLWKLEHYVSEPEFRDARPAVLYVLALVVLALAVRRRLASRSVRSQPHSEARVDGATSQVMAWRFIGGFFLASLFAWAVMFRIFRYLVPLEMLAGMLIAHFVVRLVPTRRAPLVLATILVLVVVTAKFPTWWRQRFGEHFLAVEMPAVKPDALVLLVSAQPMSYVLPSFPGDARFAGLVSNFNDPGRHNRLQQTIAETIRDHRGALYALAEPPGENVGRDALAAMGLARESCQVIRTNLRVSPLELCELRRT